MSRDFSALFALRLSCLRRRNRRRLGNLKPYLHWQAVVIYLLAGAVLLGEPIHALFVPDRIPEAVRAGGGLLLALLLGGYLAWSGYRALLTPMAGFLDDLPVGDVRFILTMPVRPRALLLDRLIWNLLRKAAGAFLLFPAAWLLGRAFLPSWGVYEAARLALFFLLCEMGVLGTALLLYGRRLCAVLLLLALVLAGVLTAPGLLQRLTAPDAAGAAFGLVPGLLRAALVWACAAWVLAWRLFRPAGARLAGDLLIARLRRVAAAAGDPTARWSPGLAHTSMEGWWRMRGLAVAWRQAAAYRHLPPSSWPSLIGALLAAAAAPWLAVTTGPWALDEAAGLPLIAVALPVTRAAAALAGAWQVELERGLTVNVLPVTPGQLLLGYALWPAIAVGAVTTAGTAAVGLWSGWPAASLLSACMLALAASFLAGVLALNEGYMTAVSLAGPLQARQQAAQATLVLAGLPVLALASGLVKPRGAASWLLLAALVAAEAVALLWSLALRLRRPLR